MLTDVQVREAREPLRWTRADLARTAFIALPVVDVVEEHGSTFMMLTEQMRTVRKAFEAVGVELIPENGGGVGVRLRKPKP